MLEHIPLGYANVRHEPLLDGFNWISVLKDLVSGAPYTEDDAIKLSYMSNWWTCCACGQLCNGLPRGVDNSPRDSQLHELGYKFNELITLRKWDKALSVIYQIEARSIELLDFPQDT